MNPVIVGTLIFKVAICTIIFLIGLRLLLLSHETFTSYLGRFLGIADIETSRSTVVILKVIGVLLVLASLALVYLFFIPKPEPTNALLQQITAYTTYV